MSKETSERTYEAILHCIGRVLHDRNEQVIKKAIPDGWLHLLKQLNEKEHGTSLPGDGAEGEPSNAKMRS